MAKIDFLFQAITPRTHAIALRDLLSLIGIERFLGSVAFVRVDGVNAIADRLKKLGAKAKLLVGIRNDITSVQALRRLQELGVDLYVVDTASRAAIFHPKIYLGTHKSGATAIIGSANLTFSGMHNNIEAGAVILMENAIPEEKACVELIIATLEGLEGRFPKNVFQITKAEQIDKLFKEGRLVDEEVTIAPTVKGRIAKDARDDLAPMKLVHQATPKRHRRLKKAAKQIAPGAAPVILAKPAKSDFELVWQSLGLKERDLNIPSGGNTHRTGDMNWKKGALTDIDQRHFFRDEIFAGLPWAKDAALPHYERTTGTFSFIIKGVDCGTFNLKLSHNTNTASRTYEQNNAMTSIKWGVASALVGKQDLLGLTMSLYRKDGTPPEFIIEIG